MEIKQRSEVLYDGKIIKVTKDHVIIEDNQAPALREVVRHPGGVGILAVDQGDILLIRQFRYVIGKELYEIPAGKLEKGEDPLPAAHRELEEETGYQCEQLTKICTMLSSPGFLDEQVTIYEAEGLYQPEKPLAMDEDERITLHRFSLTDAYAMIQSGEITDAKTILAIQYALLKMPVKHRMPENE